MRVTITFAAVCSESESIAHAIAQVPAQNRAIHCANVISYAVAENYSLFGFGYLKAFGAPSLKHWRLDPSGRS